VNASRDDTDTTLAPRGITDAQWRRFSEEEKRIIKQRRRISEEEKSLIEHSAPVLSKRTKIAAVVYLLDLPLVPLTNPISPCFNREVHR
jgi:hypothetical protein